MPLRRYEIVDILEVIEKIGWEFRDLKIKEYTLPVSENLFELICNSLKKQGINKITATQFYINPNAAVRFLIKKETYSHQLIELAILRMLGVTVNLNAQITKHLNTQL